MDGTFGEQRDWFRTTLASIGDAVIATDAEGRVKFLNGIAQLLTGWSEADALGKPLGEVFAIIHENTREPCEDPVAKVLRSGSVVGLANHTALLSRDGTERCIADSGAPIRDAEGHIIGVVLVFRDVTQQRRLEEAMRQSEERFRLLVDSVADYAILMLDGQGRVTSWNSGAERIKGYRAEEIIGRHFSCFYTPEEIEAGKPAEELRTAAARGRFEDEDWRVRKDGSRFWANVVITAVHDEAGRLRGFAKITRDMTERKQAQKTAQLNEARLQALLQLNQMSGAPLQEITDFVLEAAVSLTGSSLGYLAFANEDETVLTMHSWSKTAMSQCAIIDKPIVYPVVDTGLWGEAVRQRKPVITNDYQAPNPLKKGHPEGHVPILRHMNAPIFEGRRIVIVAGVGNKEAPYDDSDVRQLTLLMQGMWQLLQRKRSEEALRQAHDELEIRVQQRTAELAQTNTQLAHARDVAESASRAKSTFLANMSHEIRTPLNAIIGMTELVLKSQLAAQQREFLTTVKDSGEALLSVINDILDFSKIEAGKLVLEQRVFDLRESLGDTLKSFALRAHQQGLELAGFIHAEVPHMVVGDYARLRQVVVNLVGNAIKFTDQGEVTLDVVQECRTAQDVVLHFSVSDTGIGIAEDKQTAIFQMFEQGDNSMTRRHGGTGLGLAIAARLVGLMDGRIWVESGVGQGSRFHFTVRLGLSEEEPAEPLAPEPPCLHGMPVLVVDDNATNRRILVEILCSWKMAPATAPTAWEALRLIQQAQRAGTPYRLVLTDAHMPGVDGFMLAEQIKQAPESGSTVVMMLTSGDRPEDVRRCSQLGIAAYLLKPIKQSELLEAIDLALGITVPGHEPPKSVAEQPHHVERLRILLAEDSPVNQKLAVALLEGQGHTVTLACNGIEALAATGSQKFDLVLMDVQMPEMDGLEAAAKIRARERDTSTHVPIIAMTAHALKGDRERCLQAGMDSYVAKPIRAEELFDAIDAMFAGRKPLPPSSSPSSPDVVNWAEALKAVRGNRKLLKSIAEAAVEEVPRLLQALRQAVADGDHAKLRFSAHTLKGEIRYFGADQACAHAAQLEEMGHENRLAGAPPVLADLEAEAACLLESLRAYVQGDEPPTNVR